MYLLYTLCNIFIFIFYNACTLYIVQCKYFTKPIVGGDFSQNCHFVVQDAAQGYHWANDQVVIHPFIVYHKLGDELKSLSIAMISDELNHDTNAVWSFQKVLMDHLKSENIQMKKVIYFSDGCFAQYKNKKNFTNLIHHENNFNVPAEWHFFATAHGKGAFFYSC